MVSVANLVSISESIEEKFDKDYKHRLSKVAEPLVFLSITSFTVVFSYWKKIDNFKVCFLIHH